MDFFDPPSYLLIIYYYKDIIANLNNQVNQYAQDKYYRCVHIERKN